MNAVRELFENFWIRRDEDKEAYYRVKRDIPRFQRFVREQLGWKLIHTENLLKLEKIPAHAESFMGIPEFTEIRDYCLLCVVLMYLEDREEREQFLLSELIRFVEAQLAAVMEVDWTSFGQRKSLVRVLRYMEDLGMLRVYEGNSEAFGREAGQEVLYENTGISRYFATSFSEDISGFSGYRDFERPGTDENPEAQRNARVNRLYRHLAVCPSFSWENNEDADAQYLKNQRQWVAKYLDENIGGRLEVYRNQASLVLDEDDCYGIVHPRDAMLPELVLQISARIRALVEEGSLVREQNERILLHAEEFRELVLELKARWKKAWSKEYREMDEQKLVRSVEEYMKNWMMLEIRGEMYVLLPSAGRVAGFYPEDFS